MVLVVMVVVACGIESQMIKDDRMQHAALRLAPPPRAVR